MSKTFLVPSVFDADALSVYGDNSEQRLGQIERRADGTFAAYRNHDGKRNSFATQEAAVAFIEEPPPPTTGSLF